MPIFFIPVSQDVLLAITFDLEKLELKPLFFSKPPELVTDKFSVALSLEVKEKVGLIIKRYLSFLFFLNSAEVFILWSEPTP